MATITKDNYMPESSTQGLIRSLLEALLTITLPLFLAIWKGSEYMTKVAEAKALKEKQSIQEISTAVCRAVVPEIMEEYSIRSNEQLKRINQKLNDISSELKETDKRIDEVYKEMSKK